MRDRYDVVIAGAGPAGAQCARDLAARDYDVLVLETESESDFPRQSNKSTAGTFPRMLSSFNIPGEIAQQFTDKVIIESPNEYFVQEQAGAVLDFGKLKRFLVADGREDGAEYRFDARVTGPITNADDVIEGVRFNGDEEVYGDIMVDATGPGAHLARPLGLSDLKRENQAIGIEFEFEGVETVHPNFADCRDAMMLRLDHELAPGGYAWLFHTGEDTAKVGLCYIQNESYHQYGDQSMTVDDYLERWLDRDPRFENATRIEGKQSHRGSAHIQSPTRMSTDRFMAIGDTVPSIDPVWGEGIHKCMQSGRAAAITADGCLIPGEPDTDAAAMETYDSLWHELVAPRAESRLLMTRLMYLASNDRYDQLLQDMNRLDIETLAKINAGGKLAMRNLLHLSDLPLLADYARMHWLN